MRGDTSPLGSLALLVALAASSIAVGATEMAAPHNARATALGDAEARCLTQFREVLRTVGVEFSEVRSQARVAWPMSVELQAFQAERKVAVGLDTNVDGFLDSVVVYATNGEPQLTLADLNHDGRTDMWVRHGSEREGDRNFDGKLDYWEHSAGADVRIEVDLCFTGKVTRHAVVKNGRLVRVEDDRNGDDRTDRLWEEDGEDGFSVKADDNFDGTWDDVRRYTGRSLSRIFGGKNMYAYDFEPAAEIAEHQADTNNDGTMDFFTTFAHGGVASMRSDADYDGNIDSWTWYLGDSSVWAYDLDLDGKPDMWRLLWRGEELVQARDSTGDGEPDDTVLRQAVWARLEAAMGAVSGER
jgi:hypothetical protein